MELTHEYIKSVWHFYSVYSICLVLTGLKDKHIKKKNLLISSLISSFSFSKYSKLQKYMKNDFIIINSALHLLEELKEDGDFYGDYDMPDMIAISQYD